MIIYQDTPDKSKTFYQERYYQKDFGATKEISHKTLKIKPK